jgi:hypothetical protein
MAWDESSMRVFVSFGDRQVPAAVAEDVVIVHQWMKGSADNIPRRGTIGDIGNSDDHEAQEPTSTRISGRE